MTTGGPDPIRIERLAIPDLLLATSTDGGAGPADPAAAFATAAAAAFGLDLRFIGQERVSFAASGTVRGLHCQIAPRLRGKLVWLERGAVWDVAVDARCRSPSYGRHCAVTLSAGRAMAIWIPPGFLHGFCTLEADVEMGYAVTGPKAPAQARGVAWDDPVLRVPWPIPREQARLADDDRAWPGFAAAAPWFADLG